MSDNEKIFKSLNKVDQQGINAYRSARQFKYMSQNLFVMVEQRYYPTILAALVNEIFACESFLKSIIMINEKKIYKGHNIKNLVNEANIKDELSKKLAQYNLDKELINIDNAFQEWRYSYEYDELTLNSKFLNDFCNALELISRTKIKINYDIDMSDTFF